MNALLLSSLRRKVQIVLFSAILSFSAATVALGQNVAYSLAQLRNFGTTVNNSTVTLSPTGGDPHPVTGVVTPGHYWINGDHIANPTNSMPIFMELSGTGNTYDLSGATINLDTRKLDGFGRNLGHDSGVDVIRISGSNNTVQGITLIGQDIELDTDPNAQRYADWATQYVELSGDNNSVDGAHVVTRGSRTDSYGLGDAFGKGSSGGITPFLAHRKASAFRVGDATNAVINDMHLEVNTFGHGFFVQTSTDTTLTNSTVTGELFPSQGVIDHPLYQQYGTTYHQNEIPNDLLISGAEGGVRMYTGSSGLTVDNVVVTNMRTGFATSLGGGTKTLNNVEAYGVESAFGVGTNTTITNAKADGVNGPLVIFDRNDVRDSTVEVELVGDQPFNHDYALAYVNGNNVNITISSDRPAEDFEETTVFRAAQFYYENWRETNNTTVHDVAGYDHIDSVLINNTNQFMILGEQASGNVGRSQAPVIGNGKENYYDGVTIVPAGSRLEVVHAKGLGNSGAETGAEFDSNGDIVYTGTATGATLDENASIVKEGATLELQPGHRIIDEKLIITGNGVDGNGALYSDGESGSGTRFGSSNNSDESTVFLDGDASIGVGIAGNQMLVGRVQGSGNLSKRGPGILSMEKSSTLNGDLIVAEGSVVARTGVVNNSVSIFTGATLSAIGEVLRSENGTAQVDGTLDLNSRTSSGNLSHNIGSLTGMGVITASNSTVGSSGTLTVEGNNGPSAYSGTINGPVTLVKSGNGMQSLNGTMTHTGSTTVNDGVLAVNGTTSSASAVTVNNGATLAGTGIVGGSVVVNSGALVAPGNSVGTLSTGPQTWNGGGGIAIEIGDADGTAGTGWDLISLSGSLTLDSSITSGTPFIVSVDGLSAGGSPGVIPNFDNRMNYSWLIASATNITGAFAATDFQIDASAFEANNNVEAGQFSISRAGESLYLNFLPSSYSEWKLANNIPAEALITDDPEANGVPVLVEYGLDITPGAFEGLPSLDLGTGDGYEYTFNRAREELIYEVYVSTSLTEGSWELYATNPGSWGDEVTIPYSPLIDTGEAFFRLGVRLDDSP